MAFRVNPRREYSIAATGWGLRFVPLLAVLFTWATAAEYTAAPFGPRSGAGDRMAFTRMEAGRTGLQIANAYDDPSMWGARFQEFKFGAIGTGVSVADFDDDGRVDVFIVSKTGTSRLFRNLGDWRFEDVTERAGLVEESGATGWMRGLFSRTSGVAWTQGATFADVNNDGRLDLYVCRFAAPNRLYINQGDGTFTEEADARGLALNDASGMAAFADFDRDGWLDVVVQTNLLSAKDQPDGQADRLFRNRGDGFYEEVTGTAGLGGRTQGHAAIWWDFDEDGWPDLYLANDFAPSDQLYRNNRDGTFSEVIDRVVPRMPHSAMGADLGDVNNDGHLDLFVADMAATTREKDQRGMARIRTLLDTHPEAPGKAAQFMQNALYLNTGRGLVREVAQWAGVAATDWTWSVRLEDLDNDGWIDAHVTNGMVRELHNADLVQRISGFESVTEGIAAEKAGPLLAETNLAYRNRGDGRFEQIGADWGLNETGVSFGAAFGDFDNDGDLDLIYANYDAPPTVLRNDAPGGHRLIVALRGTRSNRFGVGATVRVRTAAGWQVRSLVLARGYLSQSEPALHFGLGPERTIEEMVVEWPGGHVQRFENLAADRRLVVNEPEGPANLTAPTPTATAYSEQGEALGLAMKAVEGASPVREAQALVPFRFDRRGPALAVGDLNGDGRDEVVLGGTRMSPLTTSLGQTLPTTGVDDGPILLFDLDGDGDADLLRTRFGDATTPPILYRNDGGRFVETNAFAAAGQATGAVVAADFDGDGDLDVFLGARLLPGRYPRAPRSAWMRNDEGSFVDVTEAWAPGLGELGLVTSALATDLNHDGWIDLLVALEWGHVRALVNERGQRFTDATEELGFAEAGTGWWTSLAGADFNQDGRPDYVAGNVGLNTPYRAPALLFEGDFRGGGAPLLIEARLEDGRLYSLRTRQELAAWLPALNRRYPRNDDYAKATLPELVGAGRLEAARRLEATEFQSGVFLSQPDGRFRFSPLPAEAQMSILQGIVAGDQDGDGFTDVYAAQNSYAAPASTGRFAGGVGQLFRGDGRGGFTAVAPGESGLLVPGDAKAVVSLDLNGDSFPDLLVSRNDAPSLAFVQAPVAGRAFMRVRLKGERSNPTGIGALLTLTLADGKKQTVELSAGGGYWSQGPAEAVFGYPLATPPQTVSIRWPDGRTTTESFTSPPSGVLILSR